MPITNSLFIQEYLRVPTEVSYKEGCKSTHVLLLYHTYSQTNNWSRKSWATEVHTAAPATTASSLSLETPRIWPRSANKVHQPNSNATTGEVANWTGKKEPRKKTKYSTETPSARFDYSKVSSALTSRLPSPLLPCVRVLRRRHVTSELMQASCHLTSARSRRAVITYPSASVERTRESGGGSGAERRGGRRYRRYMGRGGPGLCLSPRRRGRSGGFTLRVPPSARAPRCLREAVPGCWNGGEVEVSRSESPSAWSFSWVLITLKNWDFLTHFLPNNGSCPMLEVHLLRELGIHSQQKSLRNVCSSRSRCCSCLETGENILGSSILPYSCTKVLPRGFLLAFLCRKSLHYFHIIFICVTDRWDAYMF